VDAALDLHQEALKVFEELGDRRARAVTLGDVARILANKGELNAALDLHQHELKLYEELGDQHARAVKLGDIARIQAHKGEVDTALTLHLERLKIFEVLGDRRLHAVTRGDIARILTDKGEVDAVADSEPIGSMLVAQGKVRNVADQAVDMPYADEYCCAVLANGKFLAKNPKATAAATRALLKAARWVETNPAAAAKLSVEAKYLASSVDQNTMAISHLRYVPSVSGADTAVKLAAAEMKRAGMLSPSTDVAALAQKAFAPLDGVTDEWLKSLQVEKVAGGQVTKQWVLRQYAKFDPRDVFSVACIVDPN